METSFFGTFEPFSRFRAQVRAGAAALAWSVLDLRRILSAAVAELLQVS